MKSLQPDSFAFAVYSIASQTGLIAFLLLVLHLSKSLPPVTFAALGLALGVSNILFAIANGLLSVQDSFISWSLGEKRPDEAATWLRHFLVAALTASVVLVIVMMASAEALSFFIKDRGLLKQSVSSVRLLSIVLPLQIFFQCYRTYFQSIGRPQLPAVLLWTGNFILVAGMGIWPQITLWIFVSRAAILLPIIVLEHRSRTAKPSRTYEKAKLKELCKLGLPAAGHMLLEGGVFFTLFLFATRLGTTAMGTQSVVANLVNLAFAIPYGLSIASANEIGRLLGENDNRGALRAGWRKIVITLMIMASLSLAWMTTGKSLLKIFGAPADSSIGALVIIIACFQVADGLQIVLTGHLRGWGDTKTPVIANGIGHWLIGLPLALLFGLKMKLGLVGLWAGLACGFWSVALILLGRWIYIARRVGSPPVPALGTEPSWLVLRVVSIGLWKLRGKRIRVAG